MNRIDGKTRVCGLLGNPVEHTMSPLIHNGLAEEMNKNMVYVPFLAEKEQLQNVIPGALALNLSGLNVTVPYKSDIIPYLTELDELAAKIGAVNTLVRTKKGYKGCNTDMTGLLRAMQSDQVEIRDEEVIILGAGGAARAVAFMCAVNGAAKIYMLNRTLEKAVKIAEEINTSMGRNCVEPMLLEGYQSLTGDRYLAIQSTSVGLYPHNEEAVITDVLFYKKLRAGYDLIYTPWETRFLSLVKEHGGKAYNGLKMLLYQAVDAFEMWNDCKVSEECALKIYQVLQQEIKNR